MNRNMAIFEATMKEFIEKNPNSPIRSRKNIFEPFCKRYWGLPVSRITKDSLKQFLFELKTTNDYANTNLLRIKSQLNSYMIFLAEQGFLEENPLSKVTINRKENRPPRKPRYYLSPKEIKRALADIKAHSPLLFPLVFTLAHTGARRDEIRCLTWKTLDFELESILLRLTKNGIDRFINMNDQIRELFTKIPRYHDEYVFVNQFNRLLSRTQIDDTLKKIQGITGAAKPWRSHDLRHSFARNFIKAGGEMYQLQAILGHQSIRTTMDVYAQLRSADVDKVDLYPKDSENDDF